MNLNKRIEIMVALGERLSKEDEYRDAVIKRSHYNNLWFTEDNANQAIEEIYKGYLNPTKLKKWATSYEINDAPTDMRVGLIMGNKTPYSGFHDLLSVFIAGHRSLIKLPGTDLYGMPYILRELKAIDPETEAFFEIVERLKNFDAVIVSANDKNSAYIQQYFGKYPNIIKAKQHSVAILDGQETKEDLQALARTVFSYFGLSTRNVSKVYFKKGYDIPVFMEAMDSHRDLIMHSKYKNNFDYNLAINMLNKGNMFVNQCLILREDEPIESRIASLHFSYYETEEKLVKDLQEKEKEIYQIVSKRKLDGLKTTDFFNAPNIKLDDYEGGADTMKFLSELLIKQ